MSLTKQDLADIRTVIFDAFEIAMEPRLDTLEAGQTKLETIQARLEASQTKLTRDLSELKTDHREFRVETSKRLRSIETRLDHIDGHLAALKNDVIEIYAQLKQKPSLNLSDKTFTKLPTKDKILALHNGVLSLAKHEGITLPH